MGRAMGGPVPGGDDTQAQAQEKLALLISLPYGSGDDGLGGNSCLLFPFFISSSGGPTWCGLIPW